MKKKKQREERGRKGEERASARERDEDR